MPAARSIDAARRRTGDVCNLLISDVRPVTMTGKLTAEVAGGNGPTTKPDDYWAVGIRSRLIAMREPSDPAVRNDAAPNKAGLVYRGLQEHSGTTLEHIQPRRHTPKTRDKSHSHVL